MFGRLSLLVAAGLAGPLVSLASRALAPVVVGELIAGILLGRTGFAIIDPGAQPAPAFRAIGFAMLMLAAGTHVDVGSPTMRAGLRRGLVSFGTVAALSVPAGVLVDASLGLGHPALLAVLIAGSSAAVVFPMLEERPLSGGGLAQLLAWMALADSATVLVMPLTLTGSAGLGRALVGDAAIVAAGIAILVLIERVRSRETTRQAVRESLRRQWALQLRLSVLLLFLLSWIAEGMGASTLVAGFLAGMVLARLGEPDRLSLQLMGLANGFFVPVFFVILGSELDLRALVSSPSAVALALAMAAVPAAIHLAAGALTGPPRRRTGIGLAAAAQLGLPAAAASLGISGHSLSAATAAALVTGACLTLAPAVVGVNLLTRAGSDPPGPEPPRPPGVRPARTPVIPW